MVRRWWFYLTAHQAIWGGAPPPISNLLLEDGVSFLMMEDGTSKLTMES